MKIMNKKYVDFINVISFVIFKTQYYIVAKLGRF